MLLFKIGLFRFRDEMDDATLLEFDQELPTLSQMRPTIYGWISSQKSKIRTDCDWVNLDSGESTIKGNRTINQDPNRRIILQSSIKSVSYTHLTLPTKRIV